MCMVLRPAYWSRHPEAPAPSRAEALPVQTEGVSALRWGFFFWCSDLAVVASLALFMTIVTPHAKFGERASSSAISEKANLNRHVGMRLGDQPRELLRTADRLVPVADNNIAGGEPRESSRRLRVNTLDKCAVAHRFGCDAKVTSEVRIDRMAGDVERRSAGYDGQGLVDDRRAAAIAGPARSRDRRACSRLRATSSHYRRRR